MRGYPRFVAIRPLVGLLLVLGLTLGPLPPALAQQVINGCIIAPQTTCVDLDLSDADLRGVDLSGANLEGTNFERANLEGANLSNANLAGADFDLAALRGVN